MSTYPISISALFHRFGCFWVTVNYRIIAYRSTYSQCSPYRFTSFPFPRLPSKNHFVLLRFFVVVGFFFVCSTLPVKHLIACCYCFVGLLGARRRNGRERRRRRRRYSLWRNILPSNTRGIFVRSWNSNAELTTSPGARGSRPVWRTTSFRQWPRREGWRKRR